MAANSVLVKLLIIGDSSVGKTCLLLRFCDDSFQDAHIATIGVDFKIRSLQIETASGPREVKLQIWDTAGQERFRVITSAFYRGSQGVMVVYDITKEESFNHVRQWITEVETNTEDQVKMILVGNKCDMTDCRAVSADDGSALAKDFNMPFVEVSAKSNLNVEKAFRTIAESIIATQDPAKDAPASGKDSVKIDAGGKKKKKKGVC